jgi:hypothetical protein
LTRRKKRWSYVKGLIKARDVYSKVNVVDLDEVPEGTRKIKGEGEFQDIKEGGEVNIVRIKNLGD